MENPAQPQQINHIISGNIIVKMKNIYIILYYIIFWQGQQRRPWWPWQPTTVKLLLKCYQIGTEKGLNRNAAASLIHQQMSLMSHFTFSPSL